MKRHISESPAGAFVLNCKKRKTDGKDVTATPGETSTILKFAGTVNQDTNITEHIAKLTKDEAKDIVNRKRPESGVKKRMEENREKSQLNRFKIVNYTRALSDPATKSSDNLTIVDVEKDTTTNDTALIAATSSSAQSSSFSNISDEPFVYDIYIADSAESMLQYSDSIDLNDLRLVLSDEVYCSYYAYI